ncbi:hypothetical protein [Micromonospora wenchangensis]
MAKLLDLLAATGPGVDTAYRADLVARFDLDLSPTGPHLLHG